jgi:hypothetical protein
MWTLKAEIREGKYFPDKSGTPRHQTAGLGPLSRRASPRRESAIMKHYGPFRSKLPVPVTTELDADHLRHMQAKMLAK